MEIRALPKPFNQGKNTGGATMDISNSEIIVTICNDPDNEGMETVTYIIQKEMVVSGRSLKT